MIMDHNSQTFILGLEQNNREMVRSVPKSDLHSHAGLAFRIEELEKRAGISIRRPPALMHSMAELNRWIQHNLAELFDDRECYEFAIRADFNEARNDGVTLIEMSVDVSFISLYNNNPLAFCESVVNIHKAIAPDIAFHPELGLARDMNPEVAIPLAMECLETGVFKCLDLYGTEDAQEPETYHDLYRFAKQRGIKCKVHTGEWGDAESLLHTVRILEPDAIQHGIAAAESEKAMKWLAQNNITLNICPTSNIRLGRVKEMAAHPIRRLFDAGVSVTLNSDDIMIFEQNVSDEYLNLYNAGTMNAADLNEIRINGLKQ